MAYLSLVESILLAVGLRLKLRELKSKKGALLKRFQQDDARKLTPYPKERDSTTKEVRGHMGPLLMASIFVYICIILFRMEHAPVPSQLLMKNSTQNNSYPFFTSSTKDSLHSQVDNDEPDNAFMYASRQSLLPLLITLNHSSTTRRRYGTLPRDWVRTFVASVKRRFYNEHLLPQLWFLSEAPNIPPNLTFVGRLDRLSSDWAVMATRLWITHDVKHLTELLQAMGLLWSCRVWPRL